MLLLLAESGETDTMSAAEMCEIEKELLTALLLTALEDDSAYRVPISLNVCRQYMEEMKYFFSRNSTCYAASPGCICSVNQLLQ